MQSIITRFSIVNARGGSVSQDIEFLEVEEARKLLFASTMKDDRQLKDNIRHHEFPLNLFNIQPSLLTNVLYGENGSGKTTFLKLMQDAGGFIQSVFNIDRKRGFASDEDLIDWHQGRIPKAYQNPMNPSLLRFEDLKENLVFESICDATRGPRKWNPAFGKAIGYQKPLISSFRLEMEGVFAPPGLLGEEGHSGDMKFVCKIEPIDGFEWELNDRLMEVDNFHGTFYRLHLRLDAFRNDYNADIAKRPDNALLDISMEEGTFHPYWAELNIPLLVNQSEGVLPLGRMVLNPDLEVSEEFRWEDDSFEDKWVDEENKIRNPKFSLFYNLVVGQAVGDLDDIEKGEISSPNCEFFRHAAVYATEGLSSDFFLSPAAELEEKGTKTGTIPLPSFKRKEHYELWNDILHGNSAGTFDDENPYEYTDVSFCQVLSGNYGFILDLVKTLKSAYTFSPDYNPKPLVIETPERGRFDNRFVNDDPLKYLHLMYILDPPEKAIDGVVDSIQFSKEIPGNLGQQLETLGDIEDMLGPVGRSNRLFSAFIGDIFVADLDSQMEFYMGKYAELGFTEPMQEGAAKAEIKNNIVERLEYIWFVGMPMAVAGRKPRLMNALLEKHLGLTVSKPERAGRSGRAFRGKINFSPDNIWSLKSKKEIKFEHLSSGQRNLFSLISILGSEGDGPILIDEPELSLHMDWQLAMKDIVQSLVNHSKRQVFIASHSPDVILKFDDRSFPLLGEEVSDLDA